MSKTKCSLLVVDDEPYILSTLSALLSEEYEVTVADSPATARKIFSQKSVDIILTDQRMPSETGVQLLEWVRDHHPNTIRMLMTGFAELEEAIEAINRAQVFRYIFKPWKADELLASLQTASLAKQLELQNENLVEQLTELNQELESRVASRTRELEEINQELEQKNKMLEKLALTDPLTGLPNRRAMDRLAERELRRRDRYPGSLALGMIDVDHFKKINDQYLLPGGDSVLIGLAKTLTGAVRTVDFLGRIGGEEFLVIAPETGRDGAESLGERIRSTVEQTEFTYKNNAIPVHVSVGFAVAEEGVQTDYEQMKHVAAAALSKAKMTGRNRCVFIAVNRFPFDQAG